MEFFRGTVQRGAAAADLHRCVTPPRHSHPGQTCFVTVQAVNRSFRFVPTAQVRSSIDFLFALLVAEYGLLVHEFAFLSNHFHFVATDPHGRLSDFLQQFDSMLSRQLNALRGTTGSNFEKYPGIQIVVDALGVLDKAIYTLCNPVAAHLVARVRHWKGSCSFGLEYGEAVVLKRPKCGLWAETKAPKRKGKHESGPRMRYRGRSKTPEVATFTLTRPAVHVGELSDTELRRLVRDGVAAREKELAEQRAEKKVGVLGWLRVVTQHYFATPTTPRPLFQRRPRVTGRDKSLCAAVGRKLDAFVKAYRLALEAFLAGAPSVFPYGTLQMVRRYRVACATAPP